MKIIFLCVAIFCFTAAHAATTTTTLQRTNCSNAYFCGNVPNSLNEPIEYISYSQHYGRLTVYINNVMWDTGPYALLGYGTTLSNIPLSDGSGDTIYVSLIFSGGQVTGPCVQEGRVCVFPRSPVVLDGGSISH